MILLPCGASMFWYQDSYQGWVCGSTNSYANSTQQCSKTWIFSLKIGSKPGMVSWVYSVSTRKAEAGRLLWVEVGDVRQEDQKYNVFPSQKWGSVYIHRWWEGALRLLTFRVRVCMVCSSCIYTPCPSSSDPCWHGECSGIIILVNVYFKPHGIGGVYHNEKKY